MSEECKKARNTVLIPLIVLLGILMFCSSCSSQKCSLKTNHWGDYR